MPEKMLKSVQHFLKNHFHIDKNEKIHHEKFQIMESKNQKYTTYTISIFF